MTPALIVLGCIAIAYVVAELYLRRARHHQSKDVVSTADTFSSELYDERSSDNPNGLDWLHSPASYRP